MDSRLFGVRIWIESTIAGLVYVASALFFFQAWFGIHDLDVISRDLFPYAAAVVVAASFVLGIMLHNLIPTVVGPLLSEGQELG